MKEDIRNEKSADYLRCCGGAHRGGDCNRKAGDVRLMRKIFAGCAAALLVLSMAFSVYALEVPTDTTVRNLDGVQE